MASTERAPAWKMAVAFTAVQSHPISRIFPARATTWSWFE